MGQTSVVAQIAEDRRVFSRAVPADLEALRRACRQPPDATPIPRYYAGEDISDAPEWRGLRVEIIGFRLTPDVSTVPVFHPWVYDDFPQINGPCIVGRWLHRHPGLDGFLEVIWDGRQRPSMRLRRSVHFLGPGTAEDATRLLALWTTSADSDAPPPAASELQVPQSKQRARRSRSFDLAQAVRVARAMLNGDPPQHPTTWRIAEAIANEEGSSLTESGLTSRWQRHKDYGEESITHAEVLSLARLP